MWPTMYAPSRTLFFNSFLVLNIAINGLPVFLEEAREHFDAKKMDKKALDDVQQSLQQMSLLTEILHRGAFDIAPGHDPFKEQQTVAENTLVSISQDQPGVPLPISKFLYQGDILLTPKQARTFLKEVEKDFARDAPQQRGPREKRKIVNDHEKLWSNDRPIKFSISSKFGEGTRRLIMTAVREWEKHTCLLFEYVSNPAPGEHYLNFFRGRGCYSMVGYVGGKQGISIGYGCGSTGIVEHETGHALGLWHEQSRPDRDDYVTINFDNIYRGNSYNFLKQSYSTSKTYEVPYDLGSVMHYGSQGFTNDWSKNTISTKYPGYQRTIGQREGISFYDIKVINEAYCKDKCGFRDWNPCEHGGYINPKTCRQCECPDGFSGYNCERNEEPQNAECGGMIKLDGTEHFITSPGYPSPGFERDQKCSWLIKAPKRKLVFLEFIDQFHFICPTTCKDYVEVKNATDLANTGMRYCCDHKPAKRVYAATNEMVVIFKSTIGKDIGFKARLNYWPEEPSWYDRKRKRYNDLNQL